MPRAETVSLVIVIISWKSVCCFGVQDGLPILPVRLATIMRGTHGGRAVMFLDYDILTDRTNYEKLIFSDL